MTRRSRWPSRWPPRWPPRWPIRTPDARWRPPFALAAGVCRRASAALVGRWACAAVVGLLAGTAPELPAQGREAEVDPVGTWNCLLYGPHGDLRFYLRLGADRTARMARVTEAMERSWLELSPWRRTRVGLTFRDPWNGRAFTASLRYQELGGTWQGVPGGGGWWCGAVADPADGEPPDAARLMEVPAPAIMASPRYPRAAIREAKEGRAVSCFMVTDAGEILRPSVVESTDEIFHEPALEALARSRYRSFPDESVPMPACRSFTFELRRDR